MLLNAAGAIIFLLRSFSNRYLNDKMGKYSCLVVWYVLKAYEIFLTKINKQTGGGVPESKRASELSKQLGVNIQPQQVLNLLC